MPDDILLPGTGENVAAELIAGKKYQRIKAGWGAAGAYNDPSETDPFPVTLARLLAAAVGDNIQALPVPGIAALVHKSKNYTTSPTGDALWTPASGKVYVITQVFIEWSGSNDGSIIVWGSTTGTGDTAYTAGTDRLIAQAHPTPSTKGSGGLVRNGLWVGFGAQYPVRVTTTGDVVSTVAVDGYEVTP